MASCLVVVTPDKFVLQRMGFSCETGGDWSKRVESRKKESKVLHLNHMAFTPVPPI